MSDLPFAWWDKTLTIYNKVVDPVTNRISWYRTTVDNCFWKYVNNLYNMGRYGMSTVGVQLEIKNVVCRIPKTDKYVDKRTWDSLEDKTDHFTLANGDIIVLGEVEDVIDEYVEGQRSTDLMTRYKKYDACIEIATYVDNVQTGVGLEHYRVVGK